MGLPRYDKLPEPMPEEQRLREAPVPEDWDVIVVGGGFAGLSAAIYLARAMRRTLVLDAEESLGKWEPEIQNYFGFPDGISGTELLGRGLEQAKKFGAEVLTDEVERVEIDPEGGFYVYGRHVRFHALRLLLATGLYHLPPKVKGANECIGKTLFFCKDCDGYKVQGKTIAVIGRNDEAVEYAIGLTLYSPCVMIATNGENVTWSPQHEQWTKHYEIPVHRVKIDEIDHSEGCLAALRFADGTSAKMDFVFTTRGDIYYNQLGKQLGAELDEEGQIVVDHKQRTSVPGLYAAGCVTEANCQMIISAGHGAAAAQAINRSLFEESLRNNSLKQFRKEQIDSGEAEPPPLVQACGPTRDE
ncbi:MAG TPA: NAD(P)/FAD-dependent oxidoreductase [Verrucomicrobiae bacterium]|nr:NAD(P)/FAD-dependent oxidoreductase [Verrucomicrobiae bacterium]